VTVASGSAGYLGCRKRRTVLSIQSVRMRDPVVNVRNPLILPLSPCPTGNPADASFEAELLARTRHCELFIFDHATSSLPSALSAPASLSSALGEFYAPWDALNHNDELDYWDSRRITQRAHVKPYLIAGIDAHAMGDSPKTYTLESLMRKNGGPHTIRSQSRFAII
jgi:hypothetical protein